MSRGDDEPVFDDDFVRAAAIREDDLRGGPPPAKPSKESLREVKREAKARRKAPVLYAVPGEPYGGRPAGRARRAVTVLVVLAVGGAAVWGVSRLPEPRRVARQQPVVVPSYTPSATPPAKTDPFAGTRVELWPTGAQGLTAPAAKPVGAYSARQVAQAYAATAKYLRAAMLDPRVVYGGQTAPVFATLRPEAEQAWRGRDLALLATRLRSDVKRASPIVKVNGEMKAGVRGDTLQIDFSYVFVYVVRPAARPAAPAELVTIDRFGLVDFERSGDGVSRAWLNKATYLSSHAACGVTWPHKDYVQVRLDRAAQPPPTASPTEQVNLLDPRAQRPKGCFENTGEL